MRHWLCNAHNMRNGVEWKNTSLIWVHELNQHCEIANLRKCSWYNCAVEKGISAWTLEASRFCRAQRESSACPFSFCKKLLLFKACFNQICCLLTGGRRFVIVLTWTSNYIFFLNLYIFLLILSSVVGHFHDHIFCSSRLGGKLKQRFLTF